MGGVEAPARGQQCAGDKPYNGPTCCTTQRESNLLPSRVLGVQEGTWSTREKGGNEKKKTVHSEMLLEGRLGME